MYCHISFKSNTVVFSFNRQKAASVLCQHYEGVRGDVERRLALISVLASDLAVNHSSVHHSASQLSQLYHEVTCIIMLSMKVHTPWFYIACVAPLLCFAVDSCSDSVILLYPYST